MVAFRRAEPPNYTARIRAGKQEESGRRGPLAKIAGKLLLLLLLTVASLSAESGYDKLLSVADVEKLTGVEGAKIVAPMSQPGAGGHLNFAGPDGQLLLMVNFGDAQLYKKARQQRDIIVGGQKYPMDLFAHPVPASGDEAFASPPGKVQYVIYARKGNNAVSLSTY